MMIVFDETGFNEARKSPYYFSRSDISDDDKREMLKANLDERMGEVERGEYIPIEEVFDRLERKYASQVKQAS
jgi:predicted transcriptional regulator